MRFLHLGLVFTERRRPETALVTAVTTVLVTPVTFASRASTATSSTRSPAAFARDGHASRAHRTPGSRRAVGDRVWHRHRSRCARGDGAVDERVDHVLAGPRHAQPKDRPAAHGRGAPGSKRGHRRARRRPVGVLAFIAVRRSAAVQAPVIRRRRCAGVGVPFAQPRKDLLGGRRDMRGLKDAMRAAASCRGDDRPAAFATPSRAQLARNAAPAHPDLLGDRRGRVSGGGHRLGLLDALRVAEIGLGFGRGVA